MANSTKHKKKIIRKTPGNEITKLPLLAEKISCINRKSNEKDSKLIPAQHSGQIKDNKQ